MPLIVTKRSRAPGALERSLFCCANAGTASTDVAITSVHKRPAENRRALFTVTTKMRDVEPIPLPRNGLRAVRRRDGVALTWRDGAFELAAAGFRQQGDSQQHEHVGRRRADAHRLTKTHAGCGDANERRDERADGAPRVVRKSLPGAAHARREELREGRSHSRDDAGLEEAEGEPEQQHRRIA